MIQLEVIESPDNNNIQKFTFFQNQIYLGKKIGNLWINDEELHSPHIMLEVIENQLLVHPMKETSFYLINGKRASNIRKLKINDQVTIGKTTIKLLEFSLTEKRSKKIVLTSKLDKLIQENSEKLLVIETLSRMMK